MDMKRKVGMLALAMAAAATGAGYALQGARAATAATAPGPAGQGQAPGVQQSPGVPSLMAWPQPDAAGEDIDGLEEMSATGAARPWQEP